MKKSSSSRVAQARYATLRQLTQDDGGCPYSFMDYISLGLDELGINIIQNQRGRHSFQRNEKNGGFFFSFRV